AAADLDTATAQLDALRARLQASRQDVAVAERQVALRRTDLEDTIIRAPFSGVLGLRNVSLGDYLKEGDELVALEDVSSMQVDLRLPERFLGQLRPGQPVKIELDAWPQRAFEARVEAVDVRVDADGRA
ncbi:MAG TPA: efflux RND transporter periplasmic adaptor subunit, partial [Burkholderiaceae bacterium]|nr:efflux RND transporter periplasmic adaptor subunit [Burkholderiaceae bacterium]